MEHCFRCANPSSLLTSKNEYFWAAPNNFRRYWPTLKIRVPVGGGGCCCCIVGVRDDVVVVGVGGGGDDDDYDDVVVSGVGGDDAFAR